MADSGIEDMDWTCGCKYCQAKERALSYNYLYEHSFKLGKPMELDPLKFEIEEDCTCEDCKKIKYVRKYGFSSDVNEESALTCVCKICENIRKDYYMYYAENLTAEPGCLCKQCRIIRKD